MSATSATEHDGRIEVSFSEAFALLANEDYNDVMLQGTDGVQVPATRVALSVRSEYFQKMFKKGGFQEANNQGISQQNLKAIVEYIHTNTSTMLTELAVEAGTKSGKVRTDSLDEFNSLVSLTEAAMYVGLPGLCRKAQERLKSFMNPYPCLAISILAASKQEGPRISKELISQARRICMTETGIFNDTVLGGVSAVILTSMLEEEAKKLSNVKCFQLIDAWRKSEPSMLGETKEDRQGTAKTLVQDYVKLELIDPDDLSTSVAASELVTKDQLLDAFQHQAKKAKHQHNISFGDNFCVDSLAWMNAKSNVCTSEDDWQTDVFEGSTLGVGGKYEWKISCANPNATRGAIFVGVALSTNSLNRSAFCGWHEQCWGVSGCTGCKYSDGRLCSALGDVAKFGGGSVVTMTLDLSTDNGALSISVDGKASTRIFSNLRGQLDDSDAGFRPVVSCYNGASATLVDFRKLL